MKVFEPVIGLEVHAQLKTQAKMFCGCSTRFGNDPNTQTCPVCLGMPGVLPVMNRRAVEFALKICLASECDIAPRSIFARKNYFYPDLPKAYQISQYEEPLALGGNVKILVGGKWKKISLTRIHMEEDTGKLLHPDSTYPGGTRIDFNRCGTSDTVNNATSKQTSRRSHDKGGRLAGYFSGQLGIAQVVERGAVAVQYQIGDGL